MTEGPAWSNEAIIALLGVCMALICFVVGMLWPCLYRRWNARTIMSKHWSLIGTSELSNSVLGDLESGTATRMDHVSYWRRREEVRRRQQEQYHALLELRRGGF